VLASARRSIYRKGSEQIGSETVRTECVGIPPTRLKFPRVAGILTTESHSLIRAANTFLKGDATSPTARKIVAHVVNDATPNWGGHGFAQAVKTSGAAKKASVNGSRRLGTPGARESPYSRC